MIYCKAYYVIFIFDFKYVTIFLYIFVIIFFCLYRYRWQPEHYNLLSKTAEKYYYNGMCFFLFSDTLTWLHNILRILYSFAWGKKDTFGNYATKWMYSDFVHSFELNDWTILAYLIIWMYNKLFQMIIFVSSFSL